MAALQCDDVRYCHKAFICSLLENNAMDKPREQTFQSHRDGFLELLGVRHPIINEETKPQ